MDKDLFNKLEAFSDDWNTLGDGAFFAVAEEHGITIDDWADYSEECDRRKQTNQEKKV